VLPQVIAIKTSKLVRLYGKVENTERFLSLALFQVGAFASRINFLEVAVDWCFPLMFLFSPRTPFVFAPFPIREGRSSI
jgi:hypothetical protein